MIENYNKGIQTVKNTFIQEDILRCSTMFLREGSTNKNSMTRT